MDTANLQRQLANLQRQIKGLVEKAKNETDPKQKAILQKQIIDLNTKRAELDKQFEDEVSKMHAGVGLEMEESFTKWSGYKRRQIIKEYIKNLISKRKVKK